MTEILRYAPHADSGWMLVAAPGVIAALPGDAPSAVVDGLWRRMRLGGGFESLVGAVMDSPRGHSSSFILIGDIETTQTGASFMALIGGDATFDVASGGRPQSIWAHGSSPWARTRLRNISHVAIGDLVGQTAGTLPLVSGVARARGIDLTFEDEPAVDADSPRAVSERADADPRRREFLENSVSLHDGATQWRSAKQSPATGPLRLPRVDDARQTVMFGYSVNGAQAYALDLPHRFGRNPRTNSPRSVRLVVLDSPTKTVSAVHLDIRQIGDTVIVSDLESTNGTSIRRPDADWVRLAAGESVTVPAGTLVDVGDGNVVEIMPGIPLSDGTREAPASVNH